MTIFTTVLPAGASQTIEILYIAILVFAPMLAILQVWDVQAMPRAISLGACAWAITKRALWVIGPVEALIVIACVFYRDQYVVCWNIAAGDSAAPLFGILGGLAAFGLLWFACWHFPALAFKNKMAMARGDEHLRGALVIDGTANQQRDAKWRADCERKRQGKYISSILFAGLYMPRVAEVLHTLIIGSTGTGKSVIVRGMMRSIAERAQHTGERMFICDPDGGYLSRFYSAERGDIILNPFDARSISWALFKEISAPYDADNIAAALVPDPGGADAVWDDMARLLVSSAIDVLSRVPGAESVDLYEVCCRSTVAELRELLANTPAARFLEESNERTMHSILTTVTKSLSALRYLPRGDTFSVRDWVRGGKGWLFLPYSAEQIAALRNIFRIWVRIGIFSTLSLPERDNGLWFCIDEFDALGRLEGLSDAMTRLRKFGGRVIVGLQTVGMVQKLYGDGYSDAILENQNNVLFLRCKSSKPNGDGTSKFASAVIGTRQVRRVVHSTNTSSGSGRSPGGDTSNRGTSSSTSEQFPVEDAVMASEIEQLPDLAGYLKFGTQKEWQRVTFPLDGLPVTTKSYVPATPQQETPDEGASGGEYGPSDCPR